MYNTANHVSFCMVWNENCIQYWLPWPPVLNGLCMSKVVSLFELLSLEKQLQLLSSKSHWSLWVQLSVIHTNWVIPLTLCQAGACLLLVYWHSLILTPLSLLFLLSFLLHYIGLEILMVFPNSHARQQPLLAPNSADIQFVEVNQLHWYSPGVSGCYWYGVNSCWPRCWIVHEA